MYQLNIIAGRRIAQQRSLKKVTGQQVADELGVHPTTIVHYERGVNSMTLNRFLHICDFLEVDAADVVKAIMEEAGSLDDLYDAGTPEPPRQFAVPRKTWRRKAKADPVS